MGKANSKTILTFGEIKERIIPLLNRYGIKRAGLFGSYAREQGSSSSDLDFVLDVPDSMDFSELMGLQELLKEVLDKEVDIVEFSELKGEMKYNVLKDMVLLYEQR